jgi:hypothetical protein
VRQHGRPLRAEDEPYYLEEEEKHRRVAAALKKAAPSATVRDIAVAAWEIRTTANSAAFELSPAAVKATLARLDEVLDELTAIIRSPHREIFEALDSRTQYKLGRVGRGLLTLQRWAREAPPADGFRRDRRWRSPFRKHAAAATARATATAFRALGGKRPTVITRPSNGKAYGPFLELVEEVFGALGIDASAESQARAAIRVKEPPVS